MLKCKGLVMSPNNRKHASSTALRASALIRMVMEKQAPAALSRARRSHLSPPTLLSRPIWRTTRRGKRMECR
eukprot:1157234-Pelagomonas_calceolata.AAC.4